MCGSDLQNAFSIGWNKTEQSASYCIEINPMPVKSQMVVKAFAIWSLVYFDGIFLLIKINMEKRRISNAFHECINLRLTSLSVATLAHIYKVMWWNYASSMKYAHTFKVQNTQYPYRMQTHGWNIPLYCWIGMVFAQLPCELPISFQSLFLCLSFFRTHFWH